MDSRIVSERELKYTLAKQTYADSLAAADKLGSEYVLRGDAPFDDDAGQVVVVGPQPALADDQDGTAGVVHDVARDAAEQQSA